jgi:hypothetical protein
LLALQIIPPGVEFGHMINDFDLYGDEDSPSPASEDPSIWFEVVKIIFRFVHAKYHFLFDLFKN